MSGSAAVCGSVRSSVWLSSGAAVCGSPAESIYFQINSNHIQVNSYKFKISDVI
jgi:hypothetical protein